jgi:adenosine deaminase
MNFDPSAILQFIEKLPKTETHLHIEGALPWHLLELKNPQKFSTKPEFREDDFRYSSFEQFESILIDHALAFFDSPESYHSAAKSIFDIHLQQNVKYVEISFHAGMMEFLNIPGEEILSAIRAAIPRGLEVRVFLGISRNAYTDYLGPKLEKAIKDWDELSGIDLHGLETLPMESWTESFWARASEYGKSVKAHAGEFGPAENVRHAIEKLKVRRIQHGIRAIEDEEVLKLAEDKGVIFDICPISNFKLRVINDWDQHPLSAFMDKELLCTISTDDPLSFNNSLSQEYEVCHKRLGLNPLQLAKLAWNGFEVADLNPKVRMDWQKQIKILETEWL